MRNIFSKSSKKVDEKDLSLDRLPKHIAVIMDGNGRWAKKRGLPRTAGHKAGIEALREVIRTCSEFHIGYLTLYAFSTENWKRPVDEVSALMQLLVYYLRKEVKELHKNNVKIRTIGDISRLPENSLKEINSAVNLTKNNTGLVVNIALNYGGRNEIINGVKEICQKVKDNEIDIEKIDEHYFEEFLYTKGIPDPDMVIRPSGEFRISNFLLWQIAYSEFWFSNIFWPDFNRESLIQAIIDYQKRDRRFGGIK
ncbi:isoprenyl transferase [Crassaminicella profunda]|uniref:isoprenyl transferase n=1 Tax=Crassaminicella profunda TaxID=1286698 RepID=UPI001CA5F740|nr:isoprenyl transferase [Crassaminicella profunda]QZY56786.1 isoprenyl transferase [Crassaminicella profunda]